MEETRAASLAESTSWILVQGIHYMEPVLSKGKKLLLSVLRHEKTDAVPWVPFAGVHAGRLKGYSAREVLQDGEKLFDSLLEVNRTYQPDGQPVVFDLQVEAEILGCQLLWAEKAPPSVATHPLEKQRLIPGHVPGKSDGRLPLILKVMQRMKKEIGGHTALFGLVTGPFTLASHLRGTEIFMDMFDHPEYLMELISFCSNVCKIMSDLYLDAGMDVIAVVDPLVSQISPRHFQRFLSDPFKEIFDLIHKKDAFSAFFVCGDATKNLEMMCQTGPDSLAVDENINMVSARQITEKYRITLQGNIPLTSCMLLGSQQDNMKYVVDLLEKLTLPNQVIPNNLILSPGCDMPYDVPVENVVGTLQAVREPRSTRLMLANYQSQSIDLDSIHLPDYTHLEKPLMEVFTLDSATCPACGYMLLAAERATAELVDQVDMQEYKITQPKNIARMQKLGVKNLPSILINGEIKFSSIIPSNRELIEELKKAIQSIHP
jgi:uroporphyrinogen decarboxylase